MALNLKFNEESQVRPWVIPTGLGFCVISQPSNQPLYLDIGLLFGARFEYQILSSNSKYNTKGPDGYRVATSKQSYTHLSAGEHETPEPGAGPRLFVASCALAGRFLQILRYKPLTTDW